MSGKNKLNNLNGIRKILLEIWFNLTEKITSNHILFGLWLCYYSISIYVRLCVYYRCEWVKVKSIYDAIF